MYYLQCIIKPKIIFNNTAWVIINHIKYNTIQRQFNNKKDLDLKYTWIKYTKIVILLLNYFKFV